MKPNTQKIKVQFFNPFFIHREWLKTPEEGGKTPREITDYIMDKLAKFNGQKTFLPNRIMEDKRDYKGVLIQVHEGK